MRPTVRKLRLCIEVSIGEQIGMGQYLVPNFSLPCILTDFVGYCCTGKEGLEKVRTHGTQKLRFFTMPTLDDLRKKIMETGVKLLTLL